jgi:hypothetical protein
MSFPSPAGMSLTKLPLGRNNSVLTSLFPPRESLVVTSRLGTGNSRSFFYGVNMFLFAELSCLIQTVAGFVDHLIEIPRAVSVKTDLLFKT